jgi:hypothetical protein
MEKFRLRGVAAPPRPTTRLDAARQIRAILPTETNLELLRYEFVAGETLVHQGEVNTNAFLIAEGTVEEQQQLPSTQSDRRTIMIRRISPVGIAYFQALVPEYASQAARVSVVAKTNGVAYLLDDNTFTSDAHTKRLLLEAFRGQLDAIEVLWQHKPADVIPEELIAAAEQQTSVGKPETPWTAQNLVEALLWDSAKIHTALAESHAQTTSLQEDLRRLKEDHGNLIGKFLMVRNEAEQLRSASPLVTLERERQLMTLRMLGIESWHDRMCMELKKLGLDPGALDLTEEEKLLMVGDDPQRLEEIAGAIRIRRTPQLSDEAIDAMIDGLTESPDAAPPDESRPEAEHGSYHPRYDTLPIGAKLPEPDLRYTRGPDLSPPPPPSSMTLRPPNLVPPQGPKPPALRPPPPKETAAPSDEDAIDVEWDEPVPPTETDVVLDNSGNTVVVRDHEDEGSMPGFDPNVTNVMPVITGFPPVDGSDKK